MRYLFGLVALLVTYGSLYPFAFHGGAGWDGLHALFTRGLVMPAGRADLLGNFALFVPFGYCGVLGLRRPQVFAARLLLVCAYGAALALALQIAQVFLPHRVPILGDALVNAVGVLAGGLVAAIPAFRPGARGGLGRLDRPQTVAWLIIGSWLGYRLMPFVPSLDVQSLKDSLRPLLKEPRLFLSRAFRDAVAWTAVACLWEHAPLGRHRVGRLPLLMAATLAGEVLVVNNTVSAHTVVGAGAAWIGWWLVGRHVPGRTLLVALLVGASQVVHGLYPFSWHDEPEAFRWIPFQGFLDGTMIVNATVIFEKFFFYGAFLRLLQLAGCRLALATAAGVVVTGSIEIAQTHYAGHTPEITDPILVVVVATVLYAVARAPATSCPSPPPDRASAAPRPSGDAG